MAALLNDPQRSTISVLTCVLPRGSEWLGEAWQSLESQILPDGVSWEWLVQIDGGGDLRSTIPEDDPRIKIDRNFKSFGPAIARNMALSRASGEFVKVLDADDLILPGQLSRDLSVLTQNPKIGWVTCRAADLLPDETVVDFHDDPEEGVLPNGYIHSYWLSRGIPPVVPGTLMARTSLVLAMGGWSGTPLSGDTGLLLAMEAVSDGFYLRETGMLYRKWDEQITRSSLSMHDGARRNRVALMDARVRELRRWEIRWRC